MTELKIVPFADAAAKAAHDEAQQDSGGPMQVIGNLLNAIEGVENQVHGLIQIVQDQDKRIRALEKAGKSSLIKVVP